MKIADLSRQELDALYETRLKQDFPPSELRPLSNMKYLLEQNAYRCLVCREEKAIMGYAFFALQAGAALLDYFAVSADKRGQGVGSRFFAELKKLDLGAPWLLIEVESPESATTAEQQLERERRVRFYKRCGCRATHVYSLLFGVEYQIFILPAGDAAPPSDQAVMNALESLYRMMIFPLADGDEERYQKVCRCFLRPDDSRDFTRELGRSITFLQRSRRKFMGERLRSYGFSGAMYTILLQVARHPGATQDHIANHLYIDKCNVARRTKQLEALGLIRRETDLSDRRQNNLYLTEEGRELVPVIRGWLSQWGETTAASLDPQERAVLITLLSKMTGQNER